MGDLSEHFSKSEFTCKCGCGMADVSPKLIEALEAIRFDIDMPMYIGSGYRCPKHNKEVGGAPNSQHVLGNAADVRCRNLFALYRAATRVATIRGIGIYLRPGGWIHLDVRGSYSRWAEDEKKRPLNFAEAVRRLQGSAAPKGK